MILLVKFLGILMVCIGAINMVNPAPMRKMLAFWRQGKRIYVGGLLRIFFGAIFLLSYQYAKIPGVICTLGILMVLGGLTIFILGPNRIKVMLDWWARKPNSILRLIAVFILLVGALVIYSA